MTAMNDEVDKGRETQVVQSAINRAIEDTGDASLEVEEKRNMVRTLVLSCYFTFYPPP